MSTPPSAIAPYAPMRSIGWTSIAPTDCETTGTAPGGKWIPNSCSRLNTRSMPWMMPALIDGTLNENCSAGRRRTGPRSRPSDWVGRNDAPLPPKSVTTSMNIVAAVSVWFSMPMT